MSKLKVLRISHSAALPSYRARERTLVKSYPLDLQVVVPSEWKLMGAEPGSDETEPFVVHRLSTMLTGNIPLFAFDHFRLSEVMTKFRPDIVDIHEEPYSVAGYQSALLAKQILPGAKLLFYTAQNIHKNYPPPFSMTEQFVYRSASGAYPCSSEAAAILRKKGFKGLAPVLPLGIDDTKFNTTVLDNGTRKKMRADLNLGKFVLGYFGRVESYKGIQYVLEALSFLGVDRDIQMVIVGSGTFISELQSLAQNLNLSDRIRWIGERPASEIQNWMSICDCIVVPSLTRKNWKEQFGRVVAESMACGTPVICSDSGSLPEVVGDCGLIVPEASAEPLKQALAKMYDDEILRADFAQRGIRKVQENFLWTKVIEKTIELYEAIL